MNYSLVLGPWYSVLGNVASNFLIDQLQPGPWYFAFGNIEANCSLHQLQFGPW
jgi:hypothetical protein